MNLVRIYFLLFTLSFATQALGLTVDEAYQAIPHRKMEYSAAKSTLPLVTKNDLEKFFRLSDQALVGRIETMKALHEGHAEAFALYQKKIDEVVQGLNGITNPELTELTGLLKDAIFAQREYFSNWHNGVVSGTAYHAPGTDTSVRSASGKLQQLYSVLMQRYPSEHPNNIDAFYQHLCALDFL